ncbi:MAG: cytochrome-c peroxidase [Bacteroidetes bacterium]|nr:cytochrome-c peroxidase [Bacteroidota bacterium]
MKNVFIGVCALLMVLFTAKLFSSEEPNRNVKKLYITKLEELIESLDALMKSVHSGNPDDLRNAYSESRKKFKSVEFLMAHIDHEFYLKNINGAPLPKLEKNVPERRIIEPSGFQVIDELIGEEDFDKTELLNHIENLRNKIQEMINYQRAFWFNDDIIARAVQYQLIRNYVLGVTGFDTPGTLQGIEDAASSVAGIQEFMMIWKSDWAKEAEKISSQQIKFLNKNNDFNSFDRLEYYKKYWQPHYSFWIKKFKNSGEDFWKEVPGMPIELNGKSDHLFSSDFLNKAAFLDFAFSDVNEKSIALGKRLFFDPGLSADGKVSCGTCHQPGKGYADGLPKSRAGDGKEFVDRNAPGLINALYAKAYFYDLRSEHLSQQFEHVIFSDLEFNTTLIDILKKLQSDKTYYEEFKNAFPAHANNPVNVFTFKSSLSAYITSLTGFDSEFDKFMRGENKGLSISAQRGYNLFMGKAACGTCHFAPTFSGLVPPYFNDSESEVLGVPSDTTYQKPDADDGRYNRRVLRETVDFYRHSFKTTTVRNTSVTAPYMHNGVFSNYDQLLEFYNNGGGTGHGLKVEYQTLAGDSLHLNKAELKDIEMFMRSLEFVPE